MKSAVWKVGPIRSLADVARALHRLRQFLVARHRIVDESTTRRHRIQIGSLPLATSSLPALGSSDTGVGDIIRFFKSSADPAWIITDAILEITTAASGVTLDIGTADDDTTNSTNLFSAQSVAATGIFMGSRGVRFSPTQYINGTASANPSGLTGNLYLLYTKAGVGVVT